MNSVPSKENTDELINIDVGVPIATSLLTENDGNRLFL